MSRYKETMDRIVKDRKQLQVVCTEATDENEIKAIIRELRIASMVLDRDKDLKCLGLAANQLGYDKRIFVLKDQRGRYEAWVNPVIHESQGTIDSTESCFSNLGSYRTVPRHNVIVVSDEKRGKRTLRGRRAIAFQHELDHLNGILI